MIPRILLVLMSERVDENNENSDEKSMTVVNDKLLQR
jgi:hypothetical protein